jgi:hypothetical protein
VRIVSSIVVAAHGLGFTMWFLASWIPGAKLGAGSHLLFAPGVGVGGRLGRATGLLSLAVVAGFLATAWGIYVDASWWTPLAVLTSAVSIAGVVIPWWTTVPPMSAVGAFVVDVAVLVAALVPSIGDRLTGAA